MVASPGDQAGSAGDGGGPAPCFLAQEDDFQEGFVVQAAGGFELQAQVVVGSAFVGVEDERIGAH